jgi:hypothetical protein
MMDTDHFDRLTRSVSRFLSRRALATTLGVVALGSHGLAEARKKKKRKVKRNAFGCVNVGTFCKNGGQCCSGICGGNKCRAHDESNCPRGPQEGFCDSIDVVCVASDGNDGLCDTTTGNAGFCLGDFECSECTKDADCTSICGPGAACLVCALCDGTGGTACAGPVLGSCIDL